MFINRILHLLLLFAVIIVVRGKIMNPGFESGEIAPIFNISCLKWAVITTINSPTTVMEQILELGEWCLCVVGDKKSPPEWSMKKYNSGSLIYLSEKDQSKLPYNIIPLLAWNHFGRKNIGYLVAIHHGARVIYDTDDDNILTDGTIPDLDDALSKIEEVTVGSYVYNPYPEFGSTAKGTGSPTFSWPRGFPLDKIRDNTTRDFEIGKGIRRLIHKSKVGIFQSLANHDPDVDSTDRLNRTTSFDFITNTNLNVAVPVGVMSPFNAQATIFKISAFWGLLLPITVDGRVADVWRSFYSQKLLWAISQQLAFIPPFVTQCRNTHGYMDDYVREAPLFRMAGPMILKLLNWKINSAHGNLPDALIAVFKLLNNESFIGKRDILVIEAWIKDLQSIGYKFPVFTAEKKSTQDVDHKPLVNHMNYQSVKRVLSSAKLQKECVFKGVSFDCSSIFDANFYIENYPEIFNDILPADTHDNATTAYNHWLNKGIKLGYRAHPGKKVLKIFMMTKDEWPLLKSWVLYHGHVFGFGNLYIFDNSVNQRCIRFLKHTEKSYGLHVFFTNSSLETIIFEISDVANMLATSSDFVVKFDTDEYLTGE